MIDYKNEYGTLNNQLELLAMMKDVHNLCVKNRIRYSLCGGSLLGAIRENGFIQWDDDMDIMVARSDLQNLINVINQTSTYAVIRELWVYRIRKSESKNKASSPTIDIFVIDNVPNNTFIWKAKVLIIKALQGMLKDKLETNGFSSFYKAALLSTFCFGKLFTRRFKLKMYDRTSQIGNSKSTEYVAAYNDLFKCLNLKYNGKLMMELTKHSFETEEFIVTKHSNSYLSTQYGDYMTPPNKEDRIPVHIL